MEVPEKVMKRIEKNVEKKMMSSGRMYAGRAWQQTKQMMIDEEVAKFVAKQAKKSVKGKKSVKDKKSVKKESDDEGGASKSVMGEN